MSRYSGSAGGEEPPATAAPLEARPIMLAQPGVALSALSLERRLRVATIVWWCDGRAVGVPRTGGHTGQGERPVGPLAVLDLALGIAPDHQEVTHLRAVLLEQLPQHARALEQPQAADRTVLGAEQLDGDVVPLARGPSPISVPASSSPSEF